MASVLNGAVIYDHNNNDDIDNDDDEPLKRMDIILSRRLSGMSLEQYDSLWNEQQQSNNIKNKSTNHRKMYRTWLESTGKKDVTIQEWKPSTCSTHHDHDNHPTTTTTSTPSSSSSSKDCWNNDNDGESYSSMQEERIVTFTVARTSHLYIGPPTASVRHVQRRHRLEYGTTNDTTTTTTTSQRTKRKRSILTMTVTMSGIPFGDCFQVHIRWVATEHPDKNQNEYYLDIQVGCHVHFIKSTMYV